ncbi:hypothetical protein OH77DRAFT_897037 [Trametes cingulata]|nr:hypothetical protein OH77DRAFT_897037 [Trametes cingulata]
MAGSLSLVSSTKYIHRCNSSSSPCFAEHPCRPFCSGFWRDGQPETCPNPGLVRARGLSRATAYVEGQNGGPGIDPSLRPSRRPSPQSRSAGTQKHNQQRSNSAPGACSQPLLQQASNVRASRGARPPGACAVSVWDGNTPTAGKCIYAPCVGLKDPS